MRAREEVTISNAHKAKQVEISYLDNSPYFQLRWNVADQLATIWRVPASDRGKN